MLYKVIPIFGIFDNIQRDHSYEVLLKFSHLIPFPLCRLQNIVKSHFLALDLIGSKTELNINTKNTITYHPVEALIFSRLLLSNCLNWKIYCDDHSSLSSKTAVQNELFHYFTSETVMFADGCY